MNFFKKLFKITSDSYKADKYALLALRYWLRVKKKSPQEDSRTFVTKDRIFIYLGKIDKNE